MNTVIRNLSILLVLQLALVAYVQWKPNPLAQFDSSESFVSAPISEADGLNIASKDKTLSLSKSAEGTWIVEGDLAFPASVNKLSGILDFFKEAKKGWPVGQTRASAKQFQVADDAFERKIEFKKDDKNLATLYVGDSPGFRKTYFRNGSDVQIFSLEFPSYEFGVEPKDWYDPHYLTFKAQDVQELNVNDISLHRDQDGKLAAKEDAPEGKEWSTNKAEAVVRAVSELRYTEVLGKADDTKLDLGKESFRFSVKLSGKEETHEYIISSKSIPADKTDKEAAGNATASNKYFLKASHIPYVFEVPETAVKALQDAKREGLYDEKKVEEKTEEKEADE